MKKLLLSAALILSVLGPSVTVRADNAYHLPENITDGNILHCFSWPIKYIREELPNIAAAGFGSIQISPLQRPDINEGDTWYSIYLPYDYHAFGSPGMGSREDFKKLCEEASNYGIKIIVDVALNHVNKTTPYFNPWWQVDGRWREWGGEGSNINYNDRWSITHNRLGDYVELNTENPEAIKRAVEFMEELRDLGAKGIRFDAAKHIELPSEVSRGANTQGIWPAVTDVKGLFYYGEIVGDCVNGSDEKIREYAQYIWVPDNTYSCRAAKENKGVPTAHAGGRDDMTGSHLIYWAESHDDYSNDEWSERLDQGVIDRSYCSLACRNTQAALYYSRPRARGKHDIKIEKGSTAFMSKQVVEVNKFRNAMKGKADYFTKYDNNEAACITRKGGGAVIVTKGSNVKVTIKNGGQYCPVGTYYDRVSGGEFIVTSDLISGTVGPTGVAIIYNDYQNTPVPETVTITGNREYNVAYSGNFSNGNNYIHYWTQGRENSGTQWPGVPMERALGSDGKYYWCYNVPADANMVIFNNGTSLNEGGMQSGNLPLASNYVMDNGGATIIPVKFEVGSFTPEPSPEVKSVSIEGNYNVAYSGEFGYIHYWTEGRENSGTQWPGVPMTKVTLQDGNSYWCYKVPEGTTHVIFTNGEKEDSKNQKTGDLPYSGYFVMCESGATIMPVTFTINGNPIEPDPVIIYGDYNLAYNGDKENVHFWKGNSESEYPGVKMVNTIGSDGNRYKVYKVGAGTQNVLFNTNGDENKTGDLTYTGTYVMDDKGATRIPVKFMPLQYSDVTVYVDGWTSGPVYCYVYKDGGSFENAAWPGVQMSKDGETGYWKYQVPEGLEMNSYVIVSNGSTQYPASDAKGLALNGRSKVLHIDGYAWNNYPETESDNPTVNEPERINTVWPTAKYCYFYDKDSWKTINIWAWRGTNENCNANNSWPGDKMTSIGSKYFWEVPNLNKVPQQILITKDKEDNIRTGDTNFVNGATYYPDGGHNGGEDFRNSNPSELYLLGTVKDHNWATDYDGIKFEKIDDKGIYIAYNVPLTESSTAMFNLTSALGENWNNLNSKANQSGRFGPLSDGTPITENSPAQIVLFRGDETGSVKSWQIASGNYDVIVDLYDMTVTLLKPLAVPTVEALQLAKVEKETAAPSISNYDYVTLPGKDYKVYGITVNGDNISVSQNPITDEIAFGDVALTNLALVTTVFHGNSSYSLEAKTASIGKLQSDGKFRGIISIDDAGQNVIQSKINYYYTLKQGVEVKVPMQTTAGRTTLNAYPDLYLVGKIANSERNEDSGEMMESVEFGNPSFKFCLGFEESGNLIVPVYALDLASIRTDDKFTVQGGEKPESRKSYSYDAHILSLDNDLPLKETSEQMYVPVSLVNATFTVTMDITNVTPSTIRVAGSTFNGAEWLLTLSNDKTSQSGTIVPHDSNSNGSISIATAHKDENGQPVAYIGINAPSGTNRVYYVDSASSREANAVKAKAPAGAQAAKKNSDGSFVVALRPGQGTLTLYADGDDSKAVTYNYVVTTTTPTGIDSLTDENMEDAVYYTLQGVRVINPEHGVFIRVSNGKATKVAM